jgi:GH25 family lysozyme M1 (1,4-beta-N-acetylmuramidase)
MQLGFDKSSYDGTVNWQLARSRGITHATMRATSELLEDRLYKSEYVKAIAAGVIIIPYHYYIPRHFKPQAQAQAFLNVIQGNATRAMIDLEDYQTTRGYKGIASAELKPWLDAVEQATSKKPFIYTSPSYAKDYLTLETWLSEYPLIIANYQVAAPVIPCPWTPINLAGWQFVNGADAKYYGFEQAKGCALQVMYWDQF